MKWSVSVNYDSTRVHAVDEHNQGPGRLRWHLEFPKAMSQTERVEWLRHVRYHLSHAEELLVQAAANAELMETDE